jgi:hypothetical protein
MDSPKYSSEVLFRLQARRIALDDPDALAKLEKIELREVDAFRRNRLSSKRYEANSGLMTIDEVFPVADGVNEENAVKPVVQPSSGLGSAVIPQGVVVAIAVLVAIAGALVALPAAGVVLPAAVTTISSIIVAIGAALGVASPGVRK